MADEAIHDLTAAYALDALDAEEQELYEGHLATCERCREELAGPVSYTHLTLPTTPYV